MTHDFTPADERASELFAQHLDEALDISAEPLYARKAAAWNRLSAEIDATRSVTATHRQKRRGRTRSYALWSIGAVVAIVIGFGVIRFGGDDATIHTGPQHTTNYVTRAGERGVITLPDETQLITGPATRVAVTMSRNDGLVVSLEGEALFTVTHHQRAPLTVRSGNVVARVLGTTFFVRYYQAEHDVRVAVRNGKIGIRVSAAAFASATTALQREIILSSGTVGVVNDSGLTRVIRGGSLDDMTAFASGRLTFNQTPLRHVVLELSRAYGVDLRISDSTLARAPITTSVAVTTQSLDTILEALLETLDAHVVRSGTTLRIVPGRVAHGKSSPFFTQESSYGR